MDGRRCGLFAESVRPITDKARGWDIPSPRRGIPIDRSREDGSRPADTAAQPNRPEGIGLESTLAEHLENIVAMAREVRRVLRDDGVFFLNYGDAYVAGLLVTRKP